MMTSKRDKKLAIEWAQRWVGVVGAWLYLTLRLHYGIQAYQELLLHIQHMLSSSEELVKSARVILSNVLYHMEYCEIVVRVLRTYNEVIQPRELLNDIVMLSSLHLKLMKQYSGNSGRVIVQKKRRVNKSRQRPVTGVVVTEEQLLGIWESVREEIESVVANGVPLEDVVPFDAASDTPIDDQKLVTNYLCYLIYFYHRHTTIGGICDALMDRDVDKAVALFRASRFVA